MLSDGGGSNGDDDKEAGTDDDGSTEETGKHCSAEPGGGEWRGEKPAGGNQRADGKDDQAIDSDGYGGDSLSR